MIIIYSPFYDGDTYLGDSPKSIGETYVGNMGLLHQLELRAGIHQEPRSDNEREAEYYKAMTKHIIGTMFEKSAEIDPLAVAAKLLQWRDALIMAGWNGMCDNSEANKIAVLARIEPNFKATGNADRWKHISEAYDKNNYLSECVESIQVDCPWSELPYLIQHTLKCIEEKGTKIELTVDKNASIPTLNLEHIKLVKFDDVNDAYEWFAQIDKLPEGTAVINRDNARLNHTLHTWNQPLVHSRLNDSNPQILQLFKLSMSIFSRPLNIQNLVSYLKLPMSPIPAKLRRQLAHQLLNEGGFGEKKMRDDDKMRDEWEEIINSYEFLNKEGNPTQQARAKKMPFIEPIRKNYSNGIDKTELTGYIDNLKTWAMGHFADKELSPEFKAQLKQIVSYLTSFSIALEPKPAQVCYDEIEQLMLQIYRPMDYSLQSAETGSANVITDIRSLAIPAQTLIWLDCQDEGKEIDPYDFLSTTEREYLKSEGYVIPDFDTHLQSGRSEAIRFLNNCENVILVSSAYDGTKRLSEHSMVAEVRKAKITETPAEGVFKMRNCSQSSGSVETFAPVAALEVGGINYIGRKESNTSLDTLINYPFNYVMQYVAKLTNYDKEQINSPYLSQGEVAHYFFEHIIHDSNADYNRMRQLMEDEFDLRLRDAIDATGLIMLLPENASTLTEFIVQLKDSMLALVDIMEAKNWTPVGCEINFPEGETSLELVTIGEFGARIDFLLTQEDGNYVIIDFKWSYSKNYKEKLENNLALQLELYRQVVMNTYPNKQVAGVGYYLMPKKQLLTTDFEEIPQSRLIEHIDSTNKNELFEQIKNSYKFRMNELKRGHIEEAETMIISDDNNGYYANIDVEKLCPLNVEEKYGGKGNNRAFLFAKKKSESVFKQTKKKTYNEDKELEPFEIPTSYPTLKGRLK